MTNREEEADSSCEPRLAALLAVHLVSQVLDEAYVIANAASESGKPWRYLDTLKYLRNGKLVEVVEDDLTFNISKEESMETNNLKMNEFDDVPNIVITSTPQKVTDDIQNIINDNSMIGQGDENIFIGQGDENIPTIDMCQNDYDTSTSMFINHLFDMSEVERVVFCDDTNNGDINVVPKNLLTEAMSTMINTALGFAFGQDMDNIEPQTGEKSPSTEHSGYSFLADACAADVENAIGDVAFCVNDELIVGDKDMGSSSVLVAEIAQETYYEIKNEDDKNDVVRYENAYLTLNRDYDQLSEEDVTPVLEDPKSMVLQEVELITMQTIEDESAEKDTEQEQQEKKPLTAISGVSAVSSRKSSLVQRCRTQGSRLLACLRGWWRRKTPGKRKEARVPGSARGLCPLSPDARRRAASLLGQRHLCASPTPSHQVIWKFNTVSEALVNSSRWKNYTFDVNPDECGEY